MSSLYTYFTKEPRYAGYILMVCVFLSTGIILGHTITIEEHIASLPTPHISQPTVELFSNLSLQANAVHVYDVVNDKVLYSYNEHKVYPLASITKIATALTATRLAGGNKKIVLTPEDIAITGDNGLRPYEVWDSDSLRDFTLITSSNDGAHGIAAVAGKHIPATYAHEEPVMRFVDAMNQTVKEIGLTHTTFKNPTGLDVSETVSGGYGSAADISRLMSYAITHYPDMLSITRSPHAHIQSTQHMYNASNTNPDVHKTPGILASKTGYTPLSGGNLVVAYDPFPGRPIVITVLGSTYNGRFADMYKLTHATITYLRSYN